VLAQRIGIVGVALATAIPAVLVSGVWLTIDGARKVGVPLLGVVRHSILPAVGFVAALTSFELFASTLFVKDSYMVLGIRLVLQSLVAAPLVWWMSSAMERETLKRLAMRLMRSDEPQDELVN
jgi:hypothetical protein